MEKGRDHGDEKMRKQLSTTQVARLLGVSDQSVANWIDQEELPAGRTPGGHRRVETDDLIRFLKRQKLRIPPELAPMKPSVLIVDDDPAVTKWLSLVIKRKRPGCHVLIAHDGFSAGEIVAAEHPEVVILDLYMPGLNGLEVCRKIKAKHTTRDVAVIAITAQHSPEAQKAICDAGAVACMAKPIDTEALHQLLQTLLPA